MRCSCDRWNTNIKHIDDAFVMLATHGVRYAGEQFVYCPWCGCVLNTNGEIA